MVSSALVTCSAVWFSGAWVWYATSAFRDDGVALPLIWRLMLMVTPAVCFCFGAVLAGSRHHSGFSRLDWCALGAAVLPVTLGTGVAVWLVKGMFWADFQDASMALKMLGALASLALVAVSGAVLWRTAMSNSWRTRPEGRRVA